MDLRGSVSRQILALWIWWYSCYVNNYCLIIMTITIVILYAYNLSWLDLLLLLVLACYVRRTSFQNIVYHILSYQVISHMISYWFISFDGIHFTLQLRVVLYINEWLGTVSSIEITFGLTIIDLTWLDLTWLDLTWPDLITWLFSYYYCDVMNIKSIMVVLLA